MWRIGIDRRVRVDWEINSFAADASFGVLSCNQALLDLINGASTTKKIMVTKPLDRLVPVSSAPYSASTPGLSTTSSTWGLQEPYGSGFLISRVASRFGA